ncbi:hypothetical protein B0O99DRAFT_644400 [Bisporella sp. PMI_857]|nr:hypothetical protein B0O99DRAFT_644400 [Bisporella sp. PMI_857]
MEQNLPLHGQSLRAPAAEDLSAFRECQQLAQFAKPGLLDAALRAEWVKLMGGTMNQAIEERLTCRRCNSFHLPAVTETTPNEDNHTVSSMLERISSMVYGVHPEKQGFDLASEGRRIWSFAERAVKAYDAHFARHYQLHNGACPDADGNWPTPSAASVQSALPIQAAQHSHTTPRTPPRQTSPTQLSGLATSKWSTPNCRMPTDEENSIQHAENSNQSVHVVFEAPQRSYPKPHQGKGLASSIFATPPKKLNQNRCINTDNASFANLGFGFSHNKERGTPNRGQASGAMGGTSSESGFYTQGNQQRYDKERSFDRKEGSFSNSGFQAPFDNQGGNTRNFISGNSMGRTNQQQSKALQGCSASTSFGIRPPGNNQGGGLMGGSNGVGTGLGGSKISTTTAYSAEQIQLARQMRVEQIASGGKQGEMAGRGGSSRRTRRY